MPGLGTPTGHAACPGVAPPATSHLNHTGGQGVGHGWGAFITPPVVFTEPEVSGGTGWPGFRGVGKASGWGMGLWVASQDSPLGCST